MSSLNKNPTKEKMTPKDILQRRLSYKPPKPKQQQRQFESQIEKFYNMNLTGMSKASQLKLLRSMTSQHVVDYVSQTLECGEIY